MFGFKCGGEFKTQWYRWDGYLSGTGQDVIDFLASVSNSGDLERLRDNCKLVQVVDSGGYIDRDAENPVKGFLEDIYRGKTKELLTFWDEEDWGNVAYGYIIDLDESKFKVFSPAGVPGTELPRYEKLPEYQPYDRYQPELVYERDFQDILKYDDWIDNFNRQIKCDQYKCDELQNC